MAIAIAIDAAIAVAHGPKDTAAWFANEQDKLAKRKVSRLGLAFRLPKWKTFFVLKC